MLCCELKPLTAAHAAAGSVEEECEWDVSRATHRMLPFLTPNPQGLQDLSLSLLSTPTACRV